MGYDPPPLLSRYHEDGGTPLSSWTLAGSGVGGSGTGSARRGTEREARSLAPSGVDRAARRAAVALRASAACSRCWLLSRRTLTLSAATSVRMAPIIRASLVECSRTDASLSMALRLTSSGMGHPSAKALRSCCISRRVISTGTLDSIARALPCPSAGNRTSRTRQDQAPAGQGAAFGIPDRG